MKNDLQKVIRDLASFFNRKMTDKMDDSLAEHLHIDNFRKITADMMGENGKGRKEMIEFFRKGQIGDWKNHLSENDEKWNEWIKEHNKEIDIKFKFELLDQTKKNVDSNICYL